jgi:hypothetical protein
LAHLHYNSQLLFYIYFKDLTCVGTASIITPKDSKNPPSKAALRPYINRLVRDGRYKQAYQIWSDSLPAAARPDRRYPYNRDFKLAVDGMAFNWLLSPETGADIRIAQVEGGRQLALKVEFSGARVQFANVQQMMLLPPGRYRLSGRVKAEDLRSPRGLWWHVFCATETRIGLGHTDLVSGNLPWTEFGVDFEVPADGCEAQWLQLELPARIASERKIEGQVWYQFLRIKPIPEEGDGRARNNY